MKIHLEIKDDFLSEKYEIAKTDLSLFLDLFDHKMPNSSFVKIKDFKHNLDNIIAQYDAIDSLYFRTREKFSFDSPEESVSIEKNDLSDDQLLFIDKISQMKNFNKIIITSINNEDINRSYVNYILFSIIKNKDKLKDMETVYHFLDNHFEIRFCDLILIFPKMKQEYIDKFIQNPSINPITLNEYMLKKEELPSLEDMLKEAARTKGTENRARLRRNHEAGHGDETASHPPDQQLQPSVDDVLRFFVSFADGLCFEFTKRAGSKVWELRSDVKKAFLNRRGAEIATSSNDENNREVTVAAIDAISDLDIKLRGISLQDDKTLMDSRIDSGDTLTAHLPEKKDNADEAAKRQQEAALENLITKQQEAMKNMSDDIHKGLANAMDAITAAKVRACVIHIKHIHTYIHVL